MSLPPKKFREVVLQILFSKEWDGAADALIDLLMNQQKVSKSNVKKCFERADAISEKLEEIDPLIVKASFAYDFSRISKVEKMILRLSLFEVLFGPDISEKIVIAEAVRLAKKYGNVDSFTYVNAILDSILKKLTTPSLSVADKDTD